MINSTTSFESLLFVPITPTGPRFAHPDYANVEVDLDTDTAIVIGAGNVAMDVARMLSPDVNATVAGLAIRSASQLLTSKGAPNEPPTSIAPWRSLS